MMRVGSRPRRAGLTTAPLPIVSLGLVAALFFVLPLAGLLLRAPWDDLPGALVSPPVIAALKLSLICSLWAVALSVVLGLPLAWLLARVDFPGRSVLRGIATLPVVLPPVVEASRCFLPWEGGVSWDGGSTRRSGSPFSAVFRR